MTTTPATFVLLATLAVGVAVGLQYLQRFRKPWLVNTHLGLALAGVALVAQLALAGRGTGATLPLFLLGFALIAGWGASRIARRFWRGGQLVLAGHALAGVAGFLVFLAWIRSP